MPATTHSSRMLTRTLKRPRSCQPVLLSFLYDTKTLRHYYNKQDRNSGTESWGESAPTRRRTDAQYRHRDHENGGNRQDARPRRPRDDGLWSSYGARGEVRQKDRESAFKSESDAFPPRRLQQRIASSHSTNKDATPKSWSARLARRDPPSRAADHDDSRTETDHVPFDASTIDSTKVEPPSLTTVTDREQRAFDRLRKLGTTKTAEQKASQNLEDVLEEAISKIQVDPATNEGQKHNTVLTKVRQRELQRVGDLLKGANTDLELWTLLEKHILAPVVALNLEGPASDRPKESRRGILKIKIKPKDREIIMHNFPIHLYNACRTIRASFPTSPLIFAVIPTIRKMGPSAYALGASTKLYNHVIAHAFYKFTDVDQINELLQEMEREVIEADDVTLFLLNNIMSTWQDIRRGSYGEAARVTWETDRFRRSLAVLDKLRAQLEATVQPQEAGAVANK